MASRFGPIQLLLMCQLCLRTRVRHLSGPYSRRVIQYAAAVVIESIRLGVLDRPVEPGDDGGENPHRFGMVDATFMLVTSPDSGAPSPRKRARWRDMQRIDVKGLADTRIEFSHQRIMAGNEAIRMSREALDDLPAL